MDQQISQNVQHFDLPLSPKDVAAALGVSESSVKRWVDDGRIEAVRTPGGHRRIPVEEAVRFVRASGASLVRPELVGLRELKGRELRRADLDSQAELLFEALVAGKGLEARAIVLGAYIDGARIVDLCDGPFRRALARLGELWHQDPAGVFLEHRATAIVVDVLGRLRGLTQVKEGALKAVGCAPTGDPYLIPTLAVAAALGEEGFEATNLGPETPLASLALAIERIRPQLVWVSASTPESARAVEGGLGSLAATAAACRSTLAIGGRCLENRVLRLPSDSFHCRTLAELTALARGLQSRRPE